MKQKIDSLIRTIAKQEGVTEQEVLDGIRKAIDAGYESSDPSIQAYWAELPFRGKPTPQELIAFLAAELQKETPRGRRGTSGTISFPDGRGSPWN